MRKITALLLCASLLAGCAGNTTNTEETVEQEEESVTETKEASVSLTEQLLAEMTLEEKIEQLLVISIQTYNGSNFTTMNEDVASFLTQHHPGGFIYFASNIGSTEDVVRLSDALQSTTENIPMFIAVDQEGGTVTRISSGTMMPGNMALAATGDSTNANTAAKVIGEELRALGINVDFAPSVDVNNNPDNPVIGLRSFSDDADIVSEYGKQFVNGLQEENVIACIKHYPGHGNTNTDSHTGLPSLNLTAEELHEVELVPFKELADDVEFIMTAHITYPEIDGSTYTSKLDGSEITLPATLSSVMVQGILRDELGYDGIVITDSLQMQAIKDHFDPTDSAVFALNAGVDMFLMPVVIENSDGFTQYEQYVQNIVNAVQEGEIAEERINEAVKRVLSVKEEKGLFDSSEETLEEKVTLAKTIVGSEEHKETERELARKAVTVLKKDDYSIGEENVILVGVNEGETNALSEGYTRLVNEGVISNPVLTFNSAFNQNTTAIEQAIPGSSLVVLTSWFDNSTQYNANESNMIFGNQKLIALCREYNVPVVVILTGKPYEAGCYRDADEILAVYNYVGTDTLDENGISTGISNPNIPAGLDVIFGVYSASGTLPVNVYTVENGIYTDLLYPRGYGITGE